MRRYPAVAAVLAALVLSPAAHAASPQSGTFAVRALPDAVAYVTASGACRLPDGRVGGYGKGSDGFELQAARRGTLTATLQPSGDAYVGPVGTDWRMAVYDSRMRLLASSAGPVWSNHVRVPVAAKQKVLVVACNRNGYPESTITYAFSKR